MIRQIGSHPIRSLVCVALILATAPPAVPSAAAADAAECRLAPAERRLEALLLGDRQRRAELRCHPDLAAFARSRAADMARRGYLSHRTPDGTGPNQLLRDHGYPLPPAYRDGLSNNVESIVGGIRTPEHVWRVLTESVSHRPHLLGEEPSFLEQDEYGLAYVRDIHAPHVDYWVIVIARRTRPGEIRMLCTPAHSHCFPTAETADAGARHGEASP